ncbi:hypothetical protein [Pseudoalteromonas rubra]|uniref:Uncharacterized protein n=1 Tax=Pseudoalteromonas rubra TaxID=43658 RepID=A0A5S3WX54_9GAMM|nr:hypothetical protein [Pseudoalteromonas rubra]TMP35810.1 hypothetical protein CWB98_15265 [Pseudoalteromonas rubra]
MSLFSPLHDCTNIGNKQCVAILLKKQPTKADAQIFHANVIIKKSARGAEGREQAEYSQQVPCRDLYCMH